MQVQEDHDKSHVERSPEGSLPKVASSGVPYEMLPTGQHWTNEVHMWLSDTKRLPNCAHYANTFLANGFDSLIGLAVSGLTKEDLCELGVAMGHRNLILRQIEILKDLDSFKAWNGTAQ